MCRLENVSCFRSWCKTEYQFFGFYNLRSYDDDHDDSSSSTSASKSCESSVYHFAVLFVTFHSLWCSELFFWLFSWVWIQSYLVSNAKYCVWVRILSLSPPCFLLELFTKGRPLLHSKLWRNREERGWRCLYWRRMTYERTLCIWLGKDCRQRSLIWQMPEPFAVGWRQMCNLRMTAEL